MKKSLSLIQKIYLRVKNFTDPLIALLLLIICLPLFIVLSIRIKKDSPGSIFVRNHLRIGKDGKIFHMYKFRTMREGYEKIPPNKEYKNKMFKVDNDPRITKVGEFLRKSDLDELPQLINVFRGEMNLVGPRCFLIEEPPHYKKEFPALRQLINYRTRIKPGLTGLWQVTGRNNTTLEKRLELDALYIDNLSPLLDLKILLQTLQRLFTRRWQ